MAQSAPILTLRIIWASLLLAVGAYVLIALFGAAPPLTPPDPEQLLTLTIALGVTAFGSASAAIVLPMMLGEKLPLFTRSILRWALSEAVAINGLVLALLTGEITRAIWFFGAAVVLLLAFFPTAGDATAPTSGSNS